MKAMEVFTIALLKISLKRPGENLAFLSWTGLRGAAVV
jgi:NhaP-type Na+/H+ and K+/H+ antiporter